MSPSAAEVAKRTRLRDDFPYYAAHCLKIRTKDARVESLVLNAAQKFIHASAEAQRTRIGMVRQLVLKGRQQGCSTYIGARFFHRTTHHAGIRAFILTHEMEATETLFGMTERFFAHCPEAVKPAADRDSAKELRFGRLDSSYGIGTAGNRAVGRSQTIQLFHGSEVAFWPNAESHIAGIMQAIPEAAGSEVWLESTSNGVGNWFHAEAMRAIQQRSTFGFLFVPWHWQTEYRAALPENFKLTPDENELIDLFNLDGRQLAWRRAKIATLGIMRFKQEYPSTPEEAFEVAGDDVLIGATLIRAAVGRDVAQVPAPVIWGVDPSRFGDDRKTLAKRKGNVLLAPIKVLLPNMPAGPLSDTQAVAGAVMREFHAAAADQKPSYICVDSIGVGAGVADALRRARLPNCDVIDVNVSESPSDDERFSILRDELWWKARAWFMGRAVAMPEDTDLIGEMAAVTFSYTADNRIVIESKRDMKKRLGYSPDKADALVLTFAVDGFGASPTRAARTTPPAGDAKAGY